MLTEATAAAQTKTCPVCNATFSRNRRYSRAQWARATYCSNRCRECHRYGRHGFEKGGC